MHLVTFLEEIAGLRSLQPMYPRAADKLQEKRSRLLREEVCG